MTDAQIEQQTTVNDRRAIRVFVSTEDSSDPRALRFMSRLRNAGFEVTCSPLNPAHGADPRWLNWYESECNTAIGSADVFVLAETPGLAGSSGIVAESDTAMAAARARRRPRLFVLHRAECPLPPGFRNYEESAGLLPLDVDEAVAFLVGLKLPDAISEPPALISVGGPVEEVSVCLAIYGEFLDPASVSALLGCEPTSCHRRRERRGPMSPLYKRGGWFLQERGTAPQLPEELLRRLLGKLPEDETVWLRLASDYEVQLRLYLRVAGWNRGFDLSPELIRRLAHLHAGLVVDIYAEPDQDPDRRI